MANIDNLNGTKLSTASKLRIVTFVDWFIRSQYVESWISENDSDFINYPKRASRCADYAVEGMDGKTHREVIDDWRNALKAWISDKRLWNRPSRFEDAVMAYFDNLEQWHYENGSLDSIIG